CNYYPQRHAKVLSADSLVHGQRARLVAEEPERGLQVHRRHVVGRGADLGVLQRLADPVALRRAADEEVVHVPRLVGWQLAQLAEPELRITCGGLAPESRPLVEPAQEDA